MRLWGARKQSAPDHCAFNADLEPDNPMFIVGDIHGRIDLLDKMLANAPNGAQLIFVGDLIDRGEDSANVLIRVRDLCDQGAICLMGNHEQMMLDFIEQPTNCGPHWLRNGGLQTLHSYDVRGITERAGEDELLSARNTLELILPHGMTQWIKGLPLQWSSGNIHVVHAGADPALNMDEQIPHVLQWGIPSFRTKPRSDGQWVVHGHTIVDEGMAESGRISIDTGAYATGVLTGIHITQGNSAFMST
jgi:serine/threonine protein phosphatase 1